MYGRVWPNGSRCVVSDSGAGFPSDERSGDGETSCIATMGIYLKWKSARDIYHSIGATTTRAYGNGYTAASFNRFPYSFPALGELRMKHAMPGSHICHGMPLE